MGAFSPLSPSSLHGSAVLPQPALSNPSCRFPPQLPWARGSVSHLRSLFSSFSCLPGPSVPGPRPHTALVQHAWPLHLSFSRPGSLFPRPALVAALVLPAGAPVHPHQVPAEDGALLRPWLGWGDVAQLWAWGQPVSCKARGPGAMSCQLCPVSRLLPPCSGWVLGHGVVWAPSLLVQDPEVMGQQCWLSWLCSQGQGTRGTGWD